MLIIWLLHLRKLLALLRSGHGCDWASPRSGWSPEIALLVLFVFLLTRVDAMFAGRAYAAYGGVYIASSLVWLWVFEGVRPDRLDLIGAAVCVLGAGLILLGPREMV